MLKCVYVWKVWKVTMRWLQTPPATAPPTLTPPTPAPLPHSNMCHCGCYQLLPPPTLTNSSGVKTITGAPVHQGFPPNVHRCTGASVHRCTRDFLQMSPWHIFRTWHVSMNHTCAPPYRQMWCDNRSRTFLIFKRHSPSEWPRLAPVSVAATMEEECGEKNAAYEVYTSFPIFSLSNWTNHTS